MTSAGHEDPVLTHDGPAIECKTCRTTFVHSGRGRPPVRCPDCRAAGRAKSTTDTTAEDKPVPPKSGRGIEALRKNIHMQLAALGMGWALFDTFDSRVILKNAETGAEVLANLAATNPSVRRTLEKGVELAGWGPVLLWFLQCGLPIAAHHGLIRGVPDPAKATGTPTQPDGFSG